MCEWLGLTAILQARIRRSVRLNHFTMIDVLKRHYPGLAAALKDKTSAFHPWNTVEAL